MARAHVNYDAVRRLARRSEDIRKLARRLLATEDELPKNTREFLTKLSTYNGESPLTEPQIEFLADLRDRHDRVVFLDGGKRSVAGLVEQVYGRRCELDEFEGQWVSGLRERGTTISLSPRDCRHLIALGRRPEVDVVASDEYVAIF